MIQQPFVVTQILLPNIPIKIMQYQQNKRKVIYFKLNQIKLMDNQDVCPQQIKQLKQWIETSGFKVHPAIQIPQFFDGIQGVGTKQTLPHKTIILGVPSDKIITVKRCYDDPELKSLFRSNDHLFDYEADEEAEFKILCVFIMYHKINIEKSPWRAYLKTIAAPQTAVDWSNEELVGLNKSLIQQILHVRRQCKKVQKQLCSFLKKTKQFKDLAIQQLSQLFRVCYKSVLTRCFGYYFSTACMIPVADLMNHHCQSIDHQLIHTQYQSGKGFHESYRPKHNKINCQLLGLKQPNRQLQLPFQLKYLVKQGLLERQMEQLSQLKVKDINKKIYDHIQTTIDNLSSKQQLDLQKLDFCELDDEEDNDTDEETQYEQMKTMQNIKKQQKQMMEQFKKSYVKVQKYQDVQKRVYDEFPEQKQADLATQKAQKQKQRQKIKEYQQSEDICENQLNLIPRQNSDQTPNINTNLSTNLQSHQNQQVQNSQTNHQKLPSQFPVQNVQSQPESESGSQEEQWCLDPSCYFTMSTCSPVPAGGELFNSYGSRTNRFLLVWYGFAYRDNLYDSVTLRMQALFSSSLPAAKQIVLDTYIGGQGLCFRKNQQQIVKPEELSKQFRLKRSHLSKQLIMYLRLYLLNYYKGKDLYKLFITFPSSLQFELIILRYYKQIVQSIYTRYPVEALEYLKQEYGKKTDMSQKKRIQFKIIYIQEQRKILDINMEGIDIAISVILKIKQQKQINNITQLNGSVFADIKAPMLKFLKDYFLQIKDNFPYICYHQQLPSLVSKPQSSSNTISNTTQAEQQVNKSEDQWEDVEQEENQ